MNAFESLGLNESIVKSITELGFTSPTPIQEKAIPVLLSGTKDFVGLAQTGTGKTAAFGLPLLQLIQVSDKFPQALIICPTRELCLQITNDLSTFSKHIRGLSTEAVYGGASITMQIRNLKKGVQIVVATPGRLIDLIERKAVDLGKVKYVVLDEADEMLNMGFRDDIDFVLKNTVIRDSIWLFSATMPPEVRAISKNYMTAPKEVTVGKVNSGNVNIDHQYFITQAQYRYETLKRLIDFNPGMYGIIFTRTKADAQEIAEKLAKSGYDIEALHGDLTQQQRDKVMGRFRSKSLQLLIATDVAARGIDVDGITHVINYELPDDLEVYTHRSGRTARAGKSGICVSICHSREQYKIKSLERLINKQFHKLDIPSGKEVCRKQFFHFMDKLNTADISNGEYETYLPDLMKKFETVSKEEVLQRVAALEFNHFLKYYENADDLNTRESSKFAQNDNRMQGGRRDRGSFNRRDNGYTRLFINVGTKDGFYKASFLQFILDESNLKKDVLGKIDMREMNTWVEVDNANAGRMIKSLDGKRHNNRTIRMNEADGGFKKPSDERRSTGNREKRRF
ncbi:MAG TPA: DEAD/DEAH box helicase [Ferruginibacter sp.]|jgi:ATP-dependent RNA helicase DeaD|nr:DEAD/DEAH box helicase [Bacteroidota bacterium]MCC6692032.1 DEAD/DEAH box helicase [Chitinophagaceae bacterium]HMT95620.1 DEAD/DEAH box helicase [Ferruginibacter sp.]HMU23897.1 DEAD/DEAH box helicase [Ferruginibacter sp.]